MTHDVLQHDTRHLERQPEAELQASRRIRQVRARQRLAEIRAGFRDVEAPVVRTVEQVEHFREEIDRRMTAELHTLLNAHLHPMDRIPDEALSRDDRAVEPQPVNAGDAQTARVAAADDLRALAGAVEIDATQLQAAGHLPAAVEHEPVPLIGFSQRSLAAEILRDGEWHFGEAADWR